MATPSETSKSECAARLRDTLDRNKRVCRELKEAVDNCVAKSAEPEQSDDIQSSE